MRTRSFIENLLLAIAAAATSFFCFMMASTATAYGLPAVASAFSTLGILSAVFAGVFLLAGIIFLGVLLASTRHQQVVTRTIAPKGATDVTIADGYMTYKLEGQEKKEKCLTRNVQNVTTCEGSAPIISLVVFNILVPLSCAVAFAAVIPVVLLPVISATPLAVFAMSPLASILLTLCLGALLALAVRQAIGGITTLTAAIATSSKKAELVGSDVPKEEELDTMQGISDSAFGYSTPCSDSTWMRAPAATSGSYQDAQEAFKNTPVPRAVTEAATSTAAAPEAGAQPTA